MSRKHILGRRDAIVPSTDYDEHNQEHGQNARSEDQDLQALPTIQATRSSLELSFGETGNVYRTENHQSRRVARPRLPSQMHPGQLVDDIPTRYEDHTPPPSLINVSVQSGGSGSRRNAKDFFSRAQRASSRVIAKHYRAVSDPISSSLFNAFGSIRRRVVSVDKRTSRPTSPDFAADSDTPRLMLRKVVRIHPRDNTDSLPRDDEEYSMLLGAASLYPEGQSMVNTAHLPLTPTIYAIDPPSTLYSRPNSAFYYTAGDAIIEETGPPSAIQQLNEDVRPESPFLPPGHLSIKPQETKIERPSMAENLRRIAERAERRKKQFRTHNSSEDTGQYVNLCARTDRLSKWSDTSSSDAYLIDTTRRMPVDEEILSDLSNPPDWNAAPPPVPPHHMSPSTADANFKSHLIGNPNPFWHPDDDELDSRDDSDSAGSSGRSLRDCDRNLQDQSKRNDSRSVADVEIGRVAHDCGFASIPLSEDDSRRCGQETDCSSERDSLLTFSESWSVMASEDVLGSPVPSFASLDVPHRRKSLSTDITLSDPSVEHRPENVWLSRVWEFLRGFCTEGSDLNLPYQLLLNHEPAASRTTSFLDAIHDQLFTPPGPAVISDSEWEEGSDDVPITYAQATHLQDTECTPWRDQSNYEEQVPAMIAAVEGLFAPAQARSEDLFSYDILKQSSQPMHTEGDFDNPGQEERISVESSTNEHDRKWNGSPPITIDHAYSTDGSEIWRDHSRPQGEGVNQCLEAGQRQAMTLAENNLRSHGSAHGQWEELSYWHCEHQYPNIATASQSNKWHAPLDNLVDSHERGRARRPCTAKGDFCPTPRIIHYNSPLKAENFPSIDLNDLTKSHKIGRSAVGTWVQPRMTFPAEIRSLTSRFQWDRPGWSTEGYWAGRVDTSGKVQQQAGNVLGHLHDPSLPSVYSTWQCGLPRRFAGNWALQEDWKSAETSSYSGMIALRHAGRRRERTRAGDGGVYNNSCDT